MTNNNSLAFGICLVVLAQSTAALAQANSEQWQYQLTPYIWATTLKGDTGTTTPPSINEIDISFDDVLSNLDIAMLVNFRANKGQWGANIDTVYMNLSSSQKNRISTIDIDVKQTVFSASAFYQPANTAGLELHVGARYVDLDNDIAIALHTPNTSTATVSPGDDWTEAFIGAKYSYSVSPKLDLIAYADFGGFSGKSDSMAQYLLAANYHLSNSFTLSGGYRIFDLDYNDNNFVFDVKIEGLMIGAGFSF